MSEGKLRPVVVGDGLSGFARAAWAKHDRDGGGWLPLWRHMADSGSVAGPLWDWWVPEQTRRVIARTLPGGLEDARRLLVWLATTHDIGKATPAFACQVDELAEVMRGVGLAMPDRRDFVDRKLGPHGLAGMALLRDWLVERYGWGRRDALPFVIVAGGHHGVPPTNGAIGALDEHAELLRTPGCEAAWRGVQWELLDACAEACGVVDRLPVWRGVRLPQAAQVLLTGLVIMADWIASNPDLFPYFPQAAGVGDRERVEAAWRGLDLPAPWQPAEPAEDADGLFASRFELPDGAKVRPVQEHALRLARGMAAPGLMVIEAPMGEGKTEVALAVAEVFAARSGAGGCYVALPTMATSNALFSRMLTWLRRLPCSGTADGPYSVVLAHGKAALNEDYAGLLRSGFRTIRGVEPDGWAQAGERWRASAVLVAHRWLRGRKKNLLASFAVGTIDQLLFMGLKGRHLALRHLAMAGKVVVIDEAHAYDTYMNSYLDRVLSWLGEYGVPVVVLSATLPAGRRAELVQAYTGTGEVAEVAEARGYPLITVAEQGGRPVSEPVDASGRRTEVHIERLDDDLDALAARLRAELAEGGCALVVRNTVDRVLETAGHLRRSHPEATVTVAHARFLDLDRAANDRQLLDLFGPPGKALKRPAGPYIVVASQVAEQSLDIDFDLLVSDLCPIDLLIQRMGRLHRHQRGAGQSQRPARLRAARCLVTGADWGESPIEPVNGSQRVYRLYPLLRAAAVLAPHLVADGGRPVCLPEDISPLVQAAYGPDAVGPSEWQAVLDKAHRADLIHQAEQEKKAETFQIRAAAGGKPLIGWVDAGVGDADDSPAGRAQVRDSVDSVEVLVAQRLSDGSIRTMPWLDGGRGGLEVPTETAPEARLARILASCGLRLPLRLSNPGVVDRVIAELEANCISAWQNPECHWLAGELILFLDEDCHTRLAGFDLRYSEDNGLEVARAA
ncbi:MAG TPA: CRISPR-associated helicase Cas3' [Streptosporangiaceae bacterium]